MCTNQVNFMAPRGGTHPGSAPTSDHSRSASSASKGHNNENSSDSRLADALKAVKSILESYQTEDPLSSSRSAPRPRKPQYQPSAGKSLSESPRLGRKRVRDSSPPAVDEALVPPHPTIVPTTEAIDEAVESIFDDLDFSLEEMIAAIRSFLATKHDEVIEDRLGDIWKMERYFSEGVEAWQHSVSGIIQSLEDRQQQLHQVLSAALDFISEEAEKYREAQKQEDANYERDIRNLLEGAALELEAEGMDPLDRAELFAQRARSGREGPSSSRAPWGPDHRSSTREGAEALPRGHSSRRPSTAVSGSFTTAVHPKSGTVSRALSMVPPEERRQQEKSASAAVERLKSVMPSLFDGLRKSSTANQPVVSARAGVAEGGRRMGASSTLADAGTTTSKSASRGPAPLSTQTTPGKRASQRPHSVNNSKNVSPSPRLKSRSKQ